MLNHLSRSGLKIIASVLVLDILASAMAAELGIMYCAIIYLMGLVMLMMAFRLRGANKLNIFTIFCFCVSLQNILLVPQISYQMDDFAIEISGRYIVPVSSIIAVLSLMILSANFFGRKSDQNSKSANSRGGISN
jgi:hypothetical protein